MAFHGTWLVLNKFKLIYIAQLMKRKKLSSPIPKVHPFTHLLNWSERGVSWTWWWEPLLHHWFSSCCDTSETYRVNVQFGQQGKNWTRNKDKNLCVCVCVMLLLFVPLLRASWAVKFLKGRALYKFPLLLLLLNSGVLKVLSHALSGFNTSWPFSCSCGCRVHPLNSQYTCWVVADTVCTYSCARMKTAAPAQFQPSLL